MRELDVTEKVLRRWLRKEIYRVRSIFRVPAEEHRADDDNLREFLFI
jgi:hypothetical protein